MNTLAWSARARSRARGRLPHATTYTYAVSVHARVRRLALVLVCERFPRDGVQANESGCDVDGNDYAAAVRGAGGAIFAVLDHLGKALWPSAETRQYDSLRSLPERRVERAREGRVQPEDDRAVLRATCLPAGGHGHMHWSRAVPHLYREALRDADQGMRGPQILRGFPGLHAVHNQRPPRRVYTNRLSVIGLRCAVLC